MSDVRNASLFTNPQVWDKSEKNQPFTVFIANLGSTNYNYLKRNYYDYTFHDFNAAMVALSAYGPNANDITNQVRVVVTGGQYDVSGNPWIVPSSEAGLTIDILRGARISSSTDLGAGNAALEVRARYVTLNNQGIFESDTGTQAGSAVAWGGDLSGEGDANYGVINGLRAGSFNPNNDWSDALLIRGSDFVEVNNPIIYASGQCCIRVAAAATLANCNNLYFNNVYVETKSNATPFIANASQTDSVIDGGNFINSGGVNVGINISGNNWKLLGGGLVANTTTIGAKSHVNFSGTGLILGDFRNVDWDDTASQPVQILRSNC